MGKRHAWRLKKTKETRTRSKKYILLHAFCKNSCNTISYHSHQSDPIWTVENLYVYIHLTKNKGTQRVSQDFTFQRFSTIILGVGSWESHGKMQTRCQRTVCQFVDLMRIKTCNFSSSRRGTRWTWDENHNPNSFKETLQFTSNRGTGHFRNGQWTSHRRLRSSPQMRPWNSCDTGWVFSSATATQEVHVDLLHTKISELGFNWSWEPSNLNWRKPFNWWNQKALSKYKDFFPMGTIYIYIYQFYYFLILEATYHSIPW